MKTFRIDMEADPEMTVAKGRELISKLAASLNLPPDQLEVLEEKVNRTTEEYLRDGAKKTSARGLAGLMKDTHENISGLHEAFIGLAKGSTRPRAAMARSTGRKRSPSERTPSDVKAALRNYLEALKEQ